ncbi:hypothetical protein MBLNU457_g0227t1 [Dothideomycetes sp. NU457]
MVRLALASILVVALSVNASPLASHPAWPGTEHAKSFIDFNRRIAEGTECECDLTHVTLPTAPTPLPPHSAGLTLSHIALGRGTQNYTCDTTNLTSTPTAIGAVASLFNITCLASFAPALITILPSIALDLPVPNTPSSPSQSSFFDLSGHHYFLNSTTPFFNLDTSAHDYGMGAFKKANSSAAPAGAMKGVGGKGDGAVAWLKLCALDGLGEVAKEVYRVQTAGGNPPGSCVGMPSAFEVQYAAQYWFYS